MCIPAGLQIPVLTVAVMTLSNPEDHNVWYSHWVLVRLWPPEAGITRRHHGEAPHLRLPPVQFPVILGLIPVNKADLPPGRQRQVRLGPRGGLQPAPLTVWIHCHLSSSNVESSQSQSSSLCCCCCCSLFSFDFSSLTSSFLFKIYWGSVGGLWTNKNRMFASSDQ